MKKIALIIGLIGVASAGTFLAFLVRDFKTYGEDFFDPGRYDF